MIGITFVAVLMAIGPGLAILIDRAPPSLPEEPPRPELFGPSRRAFEVYASLR